MSPAGESAVACCACQEGGERVLLRGRCLERVGSALLWRGVERVCGDGHGLCADMYTITIFCEHVAVCWDLPGYSMQPCQQFLQEEKSLRLSYHVVCFVEY